MASVLGRLERLVLNRSYYIAAIERLDVNTVHQHRHIELHVAPSAVDAILSLNGTLEPLLFMVKEGKIVDVRRA